MSRPSKQEFADLMNRFLGQEIMNEQKLDHILKNAKMAFEKEGLNGVFSYMRRITGAPVSDEKLNEILQGLLQKEPDQVWHRLNEQAKDTNRGKKVGKNVRNKYSKGFRF